MPRLSIYALMLTGFIILHYNCEIKPSFGDQIGYACNSNILHYFTDIQCKGFLKATFYSPTANKLCPNIAQSCCDMVLINKLRDRFLANADRFKLISNKISLMYELSYNLTRVQSDKFIHAMRLSNAFTLKQVENIRSILEQFNNSSHRITASKNTMNKILSYYSGLVCSICDGKASQYIYTSYPNNIYVEIDILPLKYHFGTLSHLADIKLDMLRFTQIGHTIQQLLGGSRHENLHKERNTIAQDVAQFKLNVNKCRSHATLDSSAEGGSCFEIIKGFNFFNSFGFFEDILRAFDLTLQSFVNYFKFELRKPDEEVISAESRPVINFYTSDVGKKSFLQETQYELLGSVKKGLNLYKNPMSASSFLLRCSFIYLATLFIG